MSIVFLAISRTGDDPSRHDTFEIATVHRYDEERAPVERVQHWAIRPDRLADADPDELLRTGFYDRSMGWSHGGASVVAIEPTLGTTSPSSHGGVARALAKMLLGAQLATFAIDREAEFVAEFLRAHGEPVGWVGHVDVASAAAGAIAGYSQGWVSRGRSDGAWPRSSAADLSAAYLPFDPFRLARAVGISPTGLPASALTRAVMARDVWSIIMSPILLGEPGKPDPAPGEGDLDLDDDGEADGEGEGGEGDGPVDPSAPTTAYPLAAPTGLPPGVVPVTVAEVEATTGDRALDRVIEHITDPDR